MVILNDERIENPYWARNPQISPPPVPPRVLIAKELHKTQTTQHRREMVASHHALLKENKPDPKFQDLKSI
ncbi:hypothetical protein E2C01_040676 [Portunus trituberculatus]|uniref:Uncharacterized protein n=1 Tax=Portunus trituberculatus TaxID=210409 RepID=A0A5B7FRE8_PORTR|nr:hypothetical protein [Portunus trituberculatus]